jgi:hypothetical protein
MKTRFLIWWYLLRIRLSGKEFFVTKDNYAFGSGEKLCDGLIRYYSIIDPFRMCCPLQAINAYKGSFNQAQLIIIYAADKPTDALRPRLIKACRLV